MGSGIADAAAKANPHPARSSARGARRVRRSERLDDPLQPRREDLGKRTLHVLWAATTVPSAGSPSGARVLG